MSQEALRGMLYNIHLEIVILLLKGYSRQLWIIVTYVAVTLSILQCFLSTWCPHNCFHFSLLRFPVLTLPMLCKQYIGLLCVMLVTEISLMAFYYSNRPIVSVHTYRAFLRSVFSAPLLDSPCCLIRIASSLVISVSYRPISLTINHARTLKQVVSQRMNSFHLFFLAIRRSWSDGIALIFDYIGEKVKYLLD